ncbi:MAG: efflux RND transporter permease subunit [Propionibacteriaceae bacterium]|nr:efflux RND transporter permease subunit [Propionibacteriaceae bacterium]
MTRLTNLSLAHRTVVLLLALLTIGLGVYSATALKQELIPSLDLPRGAVVAVYPGASPEVVESEVSKPMEAVVKGVPGITEVTSTSSSSISQLSFQWEYGNDADKIASDVRSAIDSISASLPSNVDPRVITGSFDDIPVMMLALTSDADADTLSQQAEDIVLPHLKSLPGVRDVTLSGQQSREVIITYDEAKLRKAGIDPSLIGQLFMANSTAIPSGTIRNGSTNLDVQTGTTYSSIEDLENLLLQGTDGPVALKEVAEVAEQPVETTSISRVNGRPSLTLSVTKNAGANTVSVAHEVNDALTQLKQQLGGNADFAVVFDQSPYIEQSIHDLSVEGGIGLAMAVLVIMLFLGSLRPTLITAVSIPLALLIALIGLWVGGYSLNILTLGALTVAIGRVVDDSIVVIENIKRHQAMGEFGRKSITRAVKEVAGAVTSSTLTTVAVFVPIGLVGGQAGEMFRPFALTVTIALLASLLVSLTVVPVLASWFMRPSVKQLADPHAEEREDSSLRSSAPLNRLGHSSKLDDSRLNRETNTWLHKAYHPILGWSLRHRALTLLIALGIFGGTIALTPHLKTDFIGSMGQESLQISQELPTGTGLEETDAATRGVEAVLASTDEVETYQTTIGGSSSLFLGSQTSTNHATFTVTLRKGSDSTAVAASLRQKLADAGEGTIEVSQGSNSMASQMVLYVESSDSEALAEGSDQVLAMLREIDDLSDPSSDLADEQKMLSVDVDEQAAADKGMTQAGIGQAVARAVRGQLLGTLTQGDTTLDVYLRSQEPVQDIDELRTIKLPVTQKMIMDVRTDAAEKVSDRQEQMTKDAKTEGNKAYNDQVKQLKKARTAAKNASKKAESQLKKAQKQLKQLQSALQQAQDAADAGLDPTTVTQSVFQLTQAVSGVTTQVIQLSQGVAAARGQVSSIDAQLKALSEQREKSLDSQAQQQELADDAKAAQKLNPKPVRLKDVADVHIVEAPGTITRVNGVRAATLTASVEGGDLGTTTAAVQQGLAGLDLPDGVTVRIGGISEQQQDAFAQLGLAMAVAVAVVYLIMVATFGSLLQPLILLVSIPFAATGALGLSLLTDTPIGVPSMIGLLMLIGIVVTNAIVLIDLINKKRAEGSGVDESIEQGARLRLRPIVMTALATIFALIPMALGITGGGVFISKPLGIVVIGGLVSSTLLTLILVPVLYDVLEKWRENGAARREARRRARLSEATEESVEEEPADA